MSRSVISLHSDHGRGSVSARAERLTAERPALYCFSHLRWNFVFQRPQHLLTRAAAHYRVFFIEEPVWENVPLATLHVDQRPEGVTIVVPVLPLDLREENEVHGTIRLLLDDLIAASPASETIHWYYTPMAMAFTDHLSADLVVYDCMDELSAFRGASPLMRECERNLFARADVVFTGGMSLYEAKRNQHHSVFAFPSSVDVTHFAAARRQQVAEPTDQASIAHPRVGFFGVIDERMDLELVAELASLRPDVHLVFLGPVVKIDAESLPQAPNIHWLGAKDYTTLPAYLSGWDVGFMPFALNQSTRFISPTKTPEFLAAGVPVVSTPIADVIKPYGIENLVEIAANAQEAAAAIDRLLTRPRREWLAKVDRKLASMSWDKTWSEMNKAMRARLEPAASTPAKRVYGVEVAGRV